MRAADLESPGLQSAPGEPAAGEAPAPSAHTRFGGLFYLLAPALELRLGEILWQACLPEGVVFTRAAAALLGPGAEADRAPELFGGGERGTRLPPVSAEQHEEIARAILGELIAALPRRGLAGYPPPLLALTGSGPERLLVATVRGDPFVVFAWPAATAEQVTAGLEVFLAAWPASAPPPRATRPLARADRRGLLRADAAEAATPAPLVPRGDGAVESAVLAQVVGAMAQLFRTRALAAGGAGEEPSIERWLEVPARVRLEPEAMTVRLPMERIDLALRRAGLDRDPGWVPWLGRAVRLAFVTDEQEGA